MMIAVASIFGFFVGMLVGVGCTQYAYKRALGPLHENVLDEMSKPKKFRSLAEPFNPVKFADSKTKTKH